MPTIYTYIHLQNKIIWHFIKFRFLYIIGYYLNERCDTRLSWNNETRDIVYNK